MASCVRNMLYQKLLKLDNPFSSYGKRNFGVLFMPHSVLQLSIVFKITGKLSSEFVIDCFSSDSCVGEQEKHPA